MAVIYVQAVPLASRCMPFQVAQVGTKHKSCIPLSAQFTESRSHWRPLELLGNAAVVKVSALKELNKNQTLWHVKAHVLRLRWPFRHWLKPSVGDMFKRRLQKRKVRCFQLLGSCA